MTMLGLLEAKHSSYSNQKQTLKTIRVQLAITW